MKITLLTRDKYLRAYAEMLLRGKAELSFGDAEGSDITLLDVDTVTAEKTSGRLIRLSKEADKADVTLPLTRSFFSSLSDKAGEARLTLGADGRSCVLDGRQVKLTAHEYALLSLIVSRGGEYVARDEISRAVFGGGNDNLINIYVHYLREKLEGGSNKIILSSRKLGYAVNKEFLGGAIC